MNDLIKKLERKKFETNEIEQEIKETIYKNISEAIQDDSKEFYKIKEIQNDFSVYIIYTFDSIQYGELEVLQESLEKINYKINHVGLLLNPKFNQPNHISVTIELKMIKDEN